MEFREKNKFGRRILDVLLGNLSSRSILHSLLDHFCDQYLHASWTEGNPCVFFFFLSFFTRQSRHVRLVCRIETTSGDVISDLASEKEKQRGEAGAER